MDHSLPMNDYQLWLNLEIFIPHPWETHQLPTWLGTFLKLCLGNLCLGNLCPMTSLLKLIPRTYSL
uniref:Uncharacterized protein n=1 Tax=Picea glauca TaxID=3330 RepID=A0A101LV13_PICGL|nr:hypothetical protein ABT39_MTgene2180 [Picea glauca]